MVWLKHFVGHTRSSIKILLSWSWTTIAVIALWMFTNIAEKMNYGSFYVTHISHRLHSLHMTSYVPAKLNFLRGVVRWSRQKFRKNNTATWMEFSARPLFRWPQLQKQPLSSKPKKLSPWLEVRFRNRTLWPWIRYSLITDWTFLVHRYEILLEDHIHANKEFAYFLPNTMLQWYRPLLSSNRVLSTSTNWSRVSIACYSPQTLFTVTPSNTKKFWEGPPWTFLMKARQ
jgi:hypothetical protein